MPTSVVHCTQLTPVDVAHILESVPMTMSLQTLTYYIQLNVHAKGELMSCSFDMLLGASKPWHTLEDKSPDPPLLPLHALGVVPPLKNAQRAVKL